MAQVYATNAQQLLAQPQPYPQGCSGFVCAVLQIPWQDADSLMGLNPTPVGVNGNYGNLSPGDIVGWLTADCVNPPLASHVAVYIGGGPGMVFIDVPGLNQMPRSLSSYGGQTVFKSSKF